MTCWSSVAAILVFACTTSAAQAASTDPRRALDFLVGRWDVRASGAGGAESLGQYAFVRELNGHVLARHAVTTDCKAPDAYDCGHGDLLYVFQEAPAQPLKAIYFDNEGHVIHYAVDGSTPDRIVFMSEPAPGPRFRLTCVREGA